MFAYVVYKESSICLVCRAHGMNERIIPRSLLHTTTVVIMMVGPH